MRVVQQALTSRVPVRRALRRAALWLALALTGQPTYAAGLPEAVTSAMQRAAIPASAASFYVAPLDGGKPLFAQNVERPMNPASTMKLVTTFAALELLGPAYTWKTRVYTTAPPVNGVLLGDLYLKGAGDPHFLEQDVWLLLTELRQRGIQEIRGDIVIDRSLFQATDYDPGQFDQEPNRPYNVGPDPLLLNFKAVTFHFVPDDARRQVRVYASPALADMTVGEIHYIDGSCGDFRARIGIDLTDPQHIHFGGGYPGSCGERELHVSLLSHADYDAQLLRALWLEVGGSLVGHVREGPVPADAQLLYLYESPPLAEVVRDINKFSNNVMARELFLTLDVEGGQGPATLDGAAKVVGEFLSSMNLAMPELVIDNGSGLSRDGRISAQSMGRLLSTAFGSPVMPEFMSSFPIVGLDGTMRHRLTGEHVAGQAHVKTGTLNDCRAIAGYVLAASGRRYVVVSFINHPNAGAAQGVQDSLLQWVYDHG